jgi:starch synthase (maltosyl-transferring)
MPPPKIYYMHPLLVGPLDRWGAHLERCRAMGFDHVAVSPLFAPGATGDVFLSSDIEAAHPVLGAATADHAVSQLAAACAAHGLALLLDVVIDRLHVDAALASEHPELFESASRQHLPDPRTAMQRPEALLARLDQSDLAQRVVSLWSGRLRRLLAAGARGLCFHNPHRLPAALWRTLNGDLRAGANHYVSLAWTPGLAWSQIEAIAGAGFDGVFSSAAWWDRRASWFVEELEILRRVAPTVIACPEAPFAPRLASRLGSAGELTNAYRQELRICAATGHGIMMPMGFEHAARQPMDARRSIPEDFVADRSADLTAEVCAANALIDRLAGLELRGETRTVTDPDDPITTLLRFDAADPRQGRYGIVVLINPDLTQMQESPIALDPMPPAAGAALGDPQPFDPSDGQGGPLAPGEVRLIQVRRKSDVVRRNRRERQAFLSALSAPRIVIDQIAPAVDHGRYATKRLVGEPIAVEADIFSDGHGAIAAELIWKAAGANDWHRAAMKRGDNDRWRGEFSPGCVGSHFFTIEAWSDEYASLCHDIEVKRQAGADFSLEAKEARRLFEIAAHGDEAARPALAALLHELDRSDVAQAAEVLLSARARDAMAVGAERRFLVRHEPPLPIEIERPQAGFAAWYELFPRSVTRDRGRHGTFNDVIARLPAIRAMGFDVLYLPPIHPIGKTNRKGRNNSLVAGPDDPGSPYAIGSEDGGHDAIHRQLGTFEDFARLQAAAAANGLEIALDFAIQCSPDHPWLRQHREWFRWRPDGSIRFAENPPKKYEDIVNVEFYANGATADVWTALRDVVLFWVERGVRIFRVDNPHTKPLPFWEWLISDIRARYPDVIFLSEAFTRPKMMYRLAKIGFSQSYTYFTWRNNKRELTEYLSELTREPVVNFFRPHFFVNTPDINPIFLQGSGRPGFLIRAALAATLSGLWGLYSGFELCEAAPLAGREEYLDSEKYEIRVRDFAAPGNIVSEITRLNCIRRTHPALQSHTGLAFCNAYNDQVVVYRKMSRSHRDMILVAVSLDPHHAQDATFEMPLWDFGLPDHAALAAEDLMRDHRFVWSGKLQRVRLDPADLPFAIWRLAPLPGQRT